MGNGTVEGQESVTGAGAPTEENGNIESPVRALELATEELWTTAEFEEAEPCDVIEISDEDMAELERAEEERPEAVGREEGIEAGGRPEQTEEEETADEIETLAGYGYPSPFTRHEVLGPYTIYPYRTVGKLFFKRGGKKQQQNLCHYPEPQV